MGLEEDFLVNDCNWCVSHGMEGDRRAKIKLLRLCSGDGVSGLYIPVLGFGGGPYSQESQCHLINFPCTRCGVAYLCLRMVTSSLEFPEVVLKSVLTCWCCISGAVTVHEGCCQGAWQAKSTCPCVVRLVPSRVVQLLGVMRPLLKEAIALPWLQACDVGSAERSMSKPSPCVAL